jgi:uncharacterized membrane protein AbrB (regulator of aidB expression)
MFLGLTQVITGISICDCRLLDNITRLCSQPFVLVMFVVTVGVNIIYHCFI